MGKYTLPEMPYAYDALEPHIDARTMEIHHTKHHQKYTDGMNGALEKLSQNYRVKILLTSYQTSVMFLTILEAQLISMVVDTTIINCFGIT